MGTKRIRIAGLPPEVKKAAIRESLNKYGEIGTFGTKRGRQLTVIMFLMV